MNRRDDEVPVAPEAAQSWDIGPIVRELRAQRERWRTARQRRLTAGGREFPARAAIERILADLCGALFPMRLGPDDLQRESEDYYVGHTLDRALRALLGQVCLELGVASAEAVHHVRRFAEALPGIRALLDADVEAAFAGDPAARSVDEVLLCYPGVLAIIHHRLAHQLHGQGLALLARIVAEIAHAQTGIDIHPGARIGRRMRPVAREMTHNRNRSVAPSGSAGPSRRLRAVWVCAMSRLARVMAGSAVIALRSDIAAGSDSRWV